MGLLYRHGNNTVHISPKLKKLYVKSAVHIKCNDYKLSQVTTR